MATYHCRELSESDAPRVERALANARVDDTLQLRRFAADPGGFGGWWYGCLDDDDAVRAVMAVQGHSGTLFGSDPEAVEAMATRMLATQRHRGGGTPHRHELFGPRHTLDPFWRIFQDIGRKVVHDAEVTLHGADTPLPPVSKRASVTIATPADERIVTEFIAESVVTAGAPDPRRTAAAAHAEHCRRLIAEGRVLIGWEAGKRPVFLGETGVVPGDPEVIWLERVFVPLPFRSRTRLIGGALAACTTVGEGAGRPIRFFAEHEPLRLAAQRAGFTASAAYRLVQMIG